MNLLLSKLDERLSAQAATITNDVTRSIMEVMDEKMNRLLEENSSLKNKVDNLEEKIRILENRKRKNNIVLYGLEEKERGELELVQEIKEIFEEASVNIECQEISTAYRLGKKGAKIRPVVATITSHWRKQLIFINKKNLPANIYVEEDFPKEVLEKRKQLIPELKEQRKKGKIAYIKYDKLVVKEKEGNEKRKRDLTSTSPEEHPRKQQINNKTKEQRLNAFDMMRNRSNSSPSLET